MYLKFGLSFAAGLFLSAVSANALTISTGAASSTDLFPFGSPDTMTYGQVFTAPITGTLDSFTLYLNDAIGGAIFGGLGAWNGPSSFATGFGVSSLLYRSNNVLTTTPGPVPYNFTPGINVTAGEQYVAFISAFGTEATGTTTMPLADNNVPFIDYVVWNNSTDPDNPAWDYLFDAGSARFDASFSTVSPVPIPAALPLLATGIMGIGGLAARRKRADRKAAA